MLKKKNINYEKKFFIDFIFNNIKIEKNNLLKIDFEKLVLFASERLMIPNLYFKLKDNKLLKYIPADLENYLEQIYQINYNRNLILIKEVKELSKVLRKNNINHVFIKGASFIFHELYDDLGERMIGDIDLLVDFKKIKKAEKIIEDVGYRNVNKYNFFNKRHIARKFKDKNLFAVELHHQLFDHNFKFLKNETVLKNKIKIKECYFPDVESMTMYNIYSTQINDKNHIYLSYDFRNYYDFLQLNRKKYIFDVKKNIYTNRYFLLIKSLKIKLNLKTEFDGELVTNLRLYLRKKLKFYLKFEYMMINFFFQIISSPKKLKEILFNAEYRNYLFKKLSNSVFLFSKE